MLLEHFSDKLRAGAISRIVEFFAAFIGLKMSFVFRTEKCALVMIEPPSQTRIARIFEINDRIFITVELNIKKQFAGAMRQPFINKFTVLPDYAPIEIAENGCRSQPVEAIVMKKYLHHPHKALGSFRLSH